MIKAVIFDMFETLVTLFEGRTYFSENIAYVYLYNNIIYYNI